MNNFNEMKAMLDDINAYRPSSSNRARTDAESKKYQASERKRREEGMKIMAERREEKRKYEKYVRNLTESQKDVIENRVEKMRPHILTGNKEEYDKIKNKTYKSPTKQDADNKCFNDTQKDITFEKSDQVSPFNKNQFRLDYLGNLVLNHEIIGPYKDNKKRGERAKFCCEYEHVISNEQGGPRVLKNCVLLNAGLNKSKGKKRLDQHNLEDLMNLNKKFGIDPQEFLKNMNRHGIESTSRRYDMCFYVDKNGIINVAQDCKGKC